MRVHVRGQLGTQLLQAFVGISRLQPDETPTIVVNSGGGVSGAKLSQLHWVTDPLCEIREDHEGTRKTPYWHSGAGRTAFRNRESVIRWLPLLDREQTKYDKKRVIVHVRGGDKNIATVESYVRLIELAKSQNPRAEVIAMGDDDSLLDTLEQHVKVIRGEAKDDWFELLWAHRVYCGPSSFVGSTLLYDVKKKVSVMGLSWCNGTYNSIEDDLRFFEEAREFCPNLEILS
jgi:hypothetical protein